MKNKRILLIAIACVIIVGGLVYLLKPKPLKAPTACTQEAKLCPDGSSVGRTGPNCEFAACPIATTTDETVGWATYSNSGKNYEFKYPPDFGANVWHPDFWPPKSAAFSKGGDPVKIGCPEIENSINNGVQPKAQKITLGGNDFSYYTTSDAGAGTLYSTYCYITEKDNNYYTLEFVIRSHTGCYQGQCGAYCGTQYEAECRKFDLARDVEKPIEKIVSTFKF